MKVPGWETFVKDWERGTRRIELERKLFPSNDTSEIHLAWLRLRYGVPSKGDLALLEREGF